MTPALTVVVVTWNATDLLEGCLRPLTGTGYEVIVVDNGSTDGTVERLRARYPWVTVVANPDNRGFAVANNQGMAVAAGRYVLLLNSDTVPTADALAALVRFLDDHQEAGIVGPTLIYPDGRPQPSCGPGPNLWTEFLAKSLAHRLVPGLRERAPARSQRVDWVTGAALCIRRELALQLTGLDEGMFMFYEDLDLCARAREIGTQVWFVSTSPIVHIGGASRRLVETRTLVESYRSSDRFFSRHGPRWRRSVLRALTIGELALRSALWFGLVTRPRMRALARARLRAHAQVLALVLTGYRWPPPPAR